MKGELLNSDGSPRDSLGGIENEIGIEENGGLRQNPVLYLATGRILTHEWQFGEDGTRLYPDHGHPEFCTAESTDFLNIAHQVAYGNVKVPRRFKQAISELQLEDKEVAAEDLRLTANTADAHGNSWGSHENTLVSADLAIPNCVNIMASHRASRIVWSGAGWVEPSSKNSRGFTYQLSEKAPHIWEVANNSTTRDRPLYNLRDEPLADKQYFHRVHNVSGENVMSPFVNALRMATEAIMLRAIAAGINFADLELQEKVYAMKLISSDPNLQQTVRTVTNVRMTGVDHQIALAERAVRSLDGQHLTAQEREWGEKWLAVLQALKTDPYTCLRKLDWVLKQHLIEQALGQPRQNGESDFSVAFAAAITYHQLYPREGKGMQLLRKGFFDYSPTEEVLEQGPPIPQTRAMVRGAVIGALVRRHVHHGAEWGRVWSNETGRGLYMPDPYAYEDERVDAFLAKAA